MLVLSRKVGQRIIIGSGIEIVVAEICGNRVKLGISAPPEVSILREELHERMQQTASSQPVLHHDANRMPLSSFCHD